jgi:hypothetical protein
MKHDTAPDALRPWISVDTSEAAHRHPSKHWSIVTWLNVLVAGLIEARAAHATYYRLVDQGVAPSVAIRASLTPEVAPDAAADLPSMNGQARPKQEHDE